MKPSKHNQTSSGCFSGVFRCLLCSRTPQTYPSDQITDPKPSNSENDSKNYTTSNDVKAKLSSVHLDSSSFSSPGIVAKLMGLDSLPTTILVPKRNNGDVVTRSRSVNFIDYLLQFDPEDNHHRRVRTSVSFREIPQPTSQRNHDLLVLFVDGIGSKKPEMGCEEVKQRKTEKMVMMNKEKKTERREKVKENPKKVLKFKNEPRRFPKGDKQNGDKRNVNRKSGVNPMEKKKKKTPLMKQKEASIEKKVTQKRTAQVKVKESYPETEYFSSDNSSPVSVLDHDNGKDGDEVFTNLESHFPEDSNSGGRTICKYPSLSFDTIDGELRNSDKKHVSSSDYTEAESDYSEVVTMVFRLTEEDTVNDSNWVFEKELNLEEICMESGEEILDQIFNEMVDELVSWI